MPTPDSPPASFVVAAPLGAGVPVVFDSPHSGLEFPPDFQPVATRGQIQTTWDAYVDELWGDAPTAGATLLAARFPRAYVDANRAVNDIDAELLDAPWPEPLVASDYTRRGMGLIRRFALPGVPMYAGRLSVAAVRSRIENYYLPYRRALTMTLDAAVRQHGAVWHFNCHSMKSAGNAMNLDRGRKRPDFVISDRDGTTAAPAFTAWVARFFSELGYAVQINDPYRGGNIVLAHGAPPRHRHSIQIEINRALYLDEATCTKHAGFDSLRVALGRFSRAIGDLARRGLPPPTDPMHPRP